MYHALFSIVLFLLVWVGAFALNFSPPGGILNTVVEFFYSDENEWETVEVVVPARASRRHRPKPRTEAWLRKYREHQPNFLSRRLRLQAKLLARGHAIPHILSIEEDFEEDFKADIELHASDGLMAQVALVDSPIITTVDLNCVTSDTETHQLEDDIEDSIEPETDIKDTVEPETDVENIVEPQAEDALSTTQMVLANSRTNAVECASCPFFGPEALQLPVVFQLLSGFTNSGWRGLMSALSAVDAFTLDCTTLFIIPPSCIYYSLYFRLPPPTPDNTSIFELSFDGLDALVCGMPSINKMVSLYNASRLLELKHTDEDVLIEEEEVSVEENEVLVEDDSSTFVVEESTDNEELDDITAFWDIAEDITKIVKTVDFNAPEVPEVPEEPPTISDDEVLDELLTIIDHKYQLVVETPAVLEHPEQATSPFLGHLKESITSNTPYLRVLDSASPKLDASESLRERVSGVDPTGDPTTWTPVANQEPKSRSLLQGSSITNASVVPRTTKWRRAPRPLQRGWVVHNVQESTPVDVDQDVATEAEPQDASAAPDDADVPKKKTRRAGAKARKRYAARALREAAEQEAAGIPLGVDVDGSVDEPSNFDVQPISLPSVPVAGPSNQATPAHQSQDKAISEPSGETQATKKKKNKRAGNTVRAARRRRGDAERAEQAIQCAADHEAAQVYLASYADIPGNVTIVESGPWRIPTTAPETFDPVYPAYIGAAFPPSLLGTTTLPRHRSRGDSGLLTIGHVARALVGTELEEFLQAAATPRSWATGVAVTHSNSRVSEDSRKAAEVEEREDGDLDVDPDFFSTKGPRRRVKAAALASYYIPVNFAKEGPVEYNPPRRAKDSFFPFVNAAFMAAGHPDLSPPCRPSPVDDTAPSSVPEDSPCSSTDPTTSVPQDATDDAPSRSVVPIPSSDPTVPVPDTHAPATSHTTTTVVTTPTVATTTTPTVATPTPTTTAIQSTSGSAPRCVRVMIPRGLNSYLGRAAAPSL